MRPTAPTFSRRIDFSAVSIASDWKVERNFCTSSRKVSLFISINPLLVPLDQERRALPTADTQRGEPLFHVPPLHLEEQRENQTRARRADRMPQRHGAAVHVKLFVRKLPQSRRTS